MTICKSLSSKYEKAMLRGDSEHFYQRRQSLRKPESNIRLLYTWSLMPYSQTLEAVRLWVGSEESLQVYQQLIDDLWIPQSPEEFALTLAALLSRERLLLHPEDDTVQSVKCGYLIPFDAISKGEDISNKQTTFERIIMSLLRVLYTFEHESNDLI